MSEGSWLPKTWQEALPQIIWGVLILGFGLEFCVSVLDGNYGRALLAAVGLGGMTALLIHGEQLKKQLLDVNPNLIFVSISLFLLVIILSPFIEEKRWPLSAWFALPVTGTDEENQKQANRSLTDEQKRKLVNELAKLRSLTPYIVVAFTNGDSDSGAYVEGFRDAIRRAGLEPRTGFTSQDNTDQVGVIIALKDPTSPPPETEPLRAALHSIGIEPKILGFPSAGFSVSGPTTFHPDIVLWIAERPL
jgi:hypothetical protein